MNESISKETLALKSTVFIMLAFLKHCGYNYYVSRGDDKVPHNTDCFYKDLKSAKIHVELYNGLHSTSQYKVESIETLLEMTKIQSNPVNINIHS